MSNFHPTLYKYEILHLNVRGVRANKHNLEKYISDCNYPEIITLNETKLGSKIRFEFTGYECASRLEFSDKGGCHGSMILIRSDIKDVVEIEDVRTKFPRDEIIGIEVKGNSKRPSLKVFTHYLPPRNSPKRQILEYIQQQNGNCLITGDFNCKNMAWGSTKTEASGTELLDQIQSNDLFIHNDGFATRCDPVTGKEDVLDLIISNFGAMSMFKSFWVGEEIGSDHFPIHSLLQFGTQSDFYIPQTRRVRSTDWKAFERHLSIWPPLEICHTGHDIDIAVEVITTQIQDAFNQACPLQPKRKPAKCRFTPEIESKIKEKRRLRREKNKAMADLDQGQVRLIMSRINKIGNEIKKLQKRARKEDFERHCESLNNENDPRKFFQTFSKISDPYTNSEPKSLTTRAIKDEWGNSAKTAQEKAYLFANRLAKVHQVPEFHGFNEGWKASVESYLQNNKKSFESRPLEKYLESEDQDDSELLQKISLQELKENLAKCKNKSAVGLDGISYTVLKRLPDSYLSQIADILSTCMQLGYFPSAWKNAKTILIPKPGKDSREAKNFRPISLLSCMGKLFERVIARRVSSHMEQNNLFSTSQSGFRAKRMTAEQLLRLSEQCHFSFKKQQTVAALFLDAEAAFDKCWHSGIKFKLKNDIQLPNRLCRLFSSFLSNRALKVFYNGCWSQQVKLGAGTPQGSPLSPLIYLIYVNDFPEGIKEFCNVSQFADDTALYSSAFTQSFAISKLQKGLNLLEGWCRRWRVKLNAAKSNLVMFSRLNESVTENFRIALFNDTIAPTPSARFLGVEFDQKLNFSKHVEDILARANKRLNVLRVVKRAGVDRRVAMKLYKTYILPLVEYGSIAFIAAPKLSIDKLQKLQNEAIRICLGLPKYIRIDLLHEYAGLQTIRQKLEKSNTKLLCSMMNHNEDVRELMRNHDLSRDLNPKSPLDILDAAIV